MYWTSLWPENRKSRPTTATGTTCAFSYRTLNNAIDGRSDDVHQHHGIEAIGSIASSAARRGADGAAYAEEHIATVREPLVVLDDELRMYRPAAPSTRLQVIAGRDRGPTAL